MKTVADVMTNMPIVVQVPGNRNDAINIMVRNKLTGLPVVRASDGQLMGIISRRDVFKNMKETQLSILMKTLQLTYFQDDKESGEESRGQPGGLSVTISASAGFAIAPASGVTFQELYTAADQALYKAKHAGKATFRMFHTS